MHSDAAARADHAAALKDAEVATARAVAQTAHDAGYRDGFAHGLDAALDPMDPLHARSVAEWRERRAALAAER